MVSSDDDAREAARAEATRHLLLYADKQLLKAERLSELLAGFQARARKTIWIAGLLALWQLVKLTLNLVRPAGDTTAWLEATRDPITLALLVFCLLAIAFQVAGHRRCSLLLQALPADDSATQDPPD
jgi:hypothetical protein